MTITLRVALVETAIVWHEPGQNRERLAGILDSLPAVDLVILPEMFTTGFSMASSRMAEPHPGPTLTWLQSQARQRNAAITGSAMVSDAGRHFNRLYFVTPDGSADQYDKRHLFRMAGEHLHYEAGRSRLVVNWRGWRICPQVCYDLRFPVFSRNTGEHYDLLLYVANWPEPRRQHWNTLLRARAIENLSYVAAVNRIGSDDNGINYAGDSCLIRFDGETIPVSSSGFEYTLGLLDLYQLQQYRQKFPAHLDQDRFNLIEVDTTG